MAQLSQISWDITFYENLCCDYGLRAVLKGWEKKLRERLAISAQFWKFWVSSRCDSVKFAYMAFTSTQTSKKFFI